jgi:hypothetical protein
MIERGLKYPPPEWRRDKPHILRPMGAPTKQLWVSGELRERIDEVALRTGLSLAQVLQLLYWTGLTDYVDRSMSRVVKSLIGRQRDRRGPGGQRERLKEAKEKLRQLSAVLEDRA